MSAGNQAAKYKGVKSWVANMLGMLVAGLLIGFVFVFATTTGVHKKAEAHDRVRAESASEPWGACVDPVLVQVSGLKSVSLLKSDRTELGTRYVLLIKQDNAGDNKVYQCEVSSAGEFIAGRYGR